jgi:hypothetical protein
MKLLLASMLLLHPVLDDPTDLRLVAAGVGDHDVVWSLDGREVATTSDREAASVRVEAGRHEVVARTAHNGPWEALARAQPSGHHGAAYVPAWTARFDGTPEAEGGLPDWLWAIPLLLVAAGAVLVPRLRGEAAINRSLLPDACTSTPGGSPSTRTTPGSERSSASPPSGPTNGRASTGHTTSSDGASSSDTATSNGCRTPFGAATPGP